MATTITHESVFGVKPGEKVDMHKANYPAVCAAAKSLVDAINAAFGSGQVRMQHYKWWSELNRHDAGLAVDIMLHSSVATKRALAHHLVELFLRHQRALRWLGMIYEHTGFSGSRMATGAERAAAGCSTFDNKADDHLDHVHIDWYVDSTTKFDKTITTYDAIHQDRATGKWVDGPVALQRPGSGFVVSIEVPAEAEQRGADDADFTTALQAVQQSHAQGGLQPLDLNSLAPLCAQS